MKKQNSILKLSVLAGGVAAFAVGCASSGMASNEHDSMGNSPGMQSSSVTPLERTEATSTVSALSYSPDTQPWASSKWPSDRIVQTIDVYTFRVPESTTVAATTADTDTFSVNTPPGSTFVEAAGGSGETRSVKVIQHSPNPR